MSHAGKEHSHYHLHANERSTRMVVLLSVLTMALELYFGYSSHSVALMMDGWHMLSHVMVLSLAWLAYRYLRQEHVLLNSRIRERVLAVSAFVSAIALLLVTLAMIAESLGKFFSPNVDASNGAIMVAVIGLAVNGASAFFLHREEEHSDLNMQAAYLHVVSDIVISIFAIVALAAARFWGLMVLDPVCGLISAVIILVWSLKLINRSWGQIRA